MTRRTGPGSPHQFVGADVLSSRTRGAFEVGVDEVEGADGLVDLRAGSPQLPRRPDLDEPGRRLTGDRVVLQRAADSRLDLADEIIAVSDEDAYETARHLARQEGIFGGITSGANVWAAIQRARIIGAGKKIVTIIADSGLKYLNGDLYK